MQANAPQGRGRGTGRGRGHFSRGRGRSFKRARRGSGSFRRGRGGYRGSGTPLTPVEPGFRFFKKSFMENPWKDLEMQLELQRKKQKLDELQTSVNTDNGERGVREEAEKEQVSSAVGLREAEEPSKA